MIKVACELVGISLWTSKLLQHLVGYAQIHGHIKPSVIAAAALALSLKVLEDRNCTHEDEKNKSTSEMWNSTLVHYLHLRYDLRLSRKIGRSYVDYQQGFRQCQKYGCAKKV